MIYKTNNVCFER